MIDIGSGFDEILGRVGATQVEVPGIESDGDRVAVRARRATVRRRAGQVLARWMGRAGAGLEAEFLAAVRRELRVADTPALRSFARRRSQMLAAGVTAEVVPAELRPDVVAERAGRTADHPPELEAAVAVRRAERAEARRAELYLRLEGERRARRPEALAVALTEVG